MSEHEAPPKPIPLDRRDPFDQRWFQIEGAVFRYLRVRLKSRDEALELLNEVYVQMRDCSDTAVILDLHSYALGMAKNIATEQHRSRWRHMRLNMQFLEQQSAARGDADELTPERICDGQQTLEQTDRALEQLPAQTRDIWEAGADGDTPKAIAERFGVERHTVYRRLRDTRQWLCEKLGLARDRKP